MAQINKERKSSSEAISQNERKSSPQILRFKYNPVYKNIKNQMTKDELFKKKGNNNDNQDE